MARKIVTAMPLISVMQRMISAIADVFEDPQKSSAGSDLKIKGLFIVNEVKTYYCKELRQMKEMKILHKVFTFFPKGYPTEF